MKIIFLIYFALCRISLIYCEYNKCCKTNHHFEKYNGTFKCTDFPSNISQIFTNKTNFLEDNVDGQCVEFFDNFNIFNIKNGKISKYRHVEEKAFPKCCPLQFAYNSHIHSCVPAKNISLSYIREPFVTIGLSNCKVILDHIIESVSQVTNSDDNSKIMDSHCLDQIDNGSFVLRICEKNTEICEKMRCINKCCPDGQSLKIENRTSRCRSGYQGINLTAISSLKSPELSEEPFALFIINQSYPDIDFDRHNSIFEYCIEYEDVEGYYIFSRPKHFQSNYYYYSIPNNEIDYEYECIYVLLLISSPLLVLIIIIYGFLIDSGKIFGKILVNYSLAVLILYIPYMIRDIPLDAVEQTVFLLVFGRFTSTAWSNILCWDIWRTFGSTTVCKELYNPKEIFTKIAKYCLYGWGLPVVATSIIWLLNKYNTILPNIIRLNVGVLENVLVPRNYSKQVFMDLPILLLDIINVVLFIKTIVYCIRIKNEVNKINDNINKNETFKKRLPIILKFLLIMGVTLISFTITASLPIENPIYKRIYNIFTLINSAYGIFLFLIFVCNKKVYSKIKQKFKRICGSTDSSNINNKF